jgi:hypothetical protein
MEAGSSENNHIPIATNAHDPIMISPIFFLLSSMIVWSMALVFGVLNLTLMACLCDSVDLRVQGRLTSQ